MVTLRICNKQTKELIAEVEISDGTMDFLKKQKNPSQTLEDAIIKGIKEGMNMFNEKKEKTIIFDIWMRGNCGVGTLQPDIDLEQTPVHMELELLESQSLTHLAETIINHEKTLNWDMDHLYHFSMDKKAWSGDPSQRYSPPLKGQPKDEKSSHTKLNAFNFKKRNTFVFVYDYGDDVQFNIKVKDFDIADDQIKYPHILKEPDLHPQQYPENKVDKLCLIEGNRKMI